MTPTRRLPTVDYARALRFLQGADSLHRGLAAFHLEGAPPAPAFAELSRFQNADGGFAGLEPDVGLAASSAVCTARALHELADLGATGDHPAVRQALGYLARSFDDARGVWAIIPAHDNSAPHAPWWHHNPELERNFGHYLDNPRADVLACLYRLPAPGTEALRARGVAAMVCERIASVGDSVEMHGLICYARLQRAPGIPASLAAALDARLPGWVARGVEMDPAKWQGYGLRPLDVAPLPGSPLAGVLGAALESNLDFLIGQQQQDGSWAPSWGWGDFFPEAWPTARARWQAILTLAALRTLKSYGRVG
jgi:hypothetical protein